MINLHGASIRRKAGTEVRCDREPACGWRRAMAARRLSLARPKSEPAAAAAPQAHSQRTPMP